MEYSLSLFWPQKIRIRSHGTWSAFGTVASFAGGSLIRLALVHTNTMLQALEANHECLSVWNRAAAPSESSAWVYCRHERELANHRQNRSRPPALFIPPNAQMRSPCPFVRAIVAVAGRRTARKQGPEPRGNLNLETIRCAARFPGAASQQT